MDYLIDRSIDISQAVRGYQVFQITQNHHLVALILSGQARQVGHAVRQADRDDVVMSCQKGDKGGGKWGYIDTQGNWKIQPQYTSAMYFSCDGYATVNDTTVIDTNGNIVLSP